VSVCSVGVVLLFAIAIGGADWYYFSLLVGVMSIIGWARQRQLVISHLRSREEFVEWASQYINKRQSAAQFGRRVISTLLYYVGVLLCIVSSLGALLLNDWSAIGLFAIGVITAIFGYIAARYARSER
jgi:hypothetical protein